MAPPSLLINHGHSLASYFKQDPRPFHQRAQFHDFPWELLEWGCGEAEGGAREGEDTAPGCAGLAPAQITLLQVTTGHMKVRAELPAAWHSFHPGTPPPPT